MSTTNLADTWILPLTAPRQQTIYHPLEPVLAQPMPKWKRVFDVVVASLLLLLASPLLLATSLYIKAVSSGPVFFRQLRIGHGGKTFTLLKLRTMRVNSDNNVHRSYVQELIRNGEAPAQKLDTRDDPRLLPLARFLRAACIDELPQLINVLRGDMSLIGPRPCVPYEAAVFHSWQRRRFTAMPGLTGLWQVSGKNRVSMTEMMRLDLRYIRDISFALDMWILLHTPLAIIKQFED